MPERKHHKLAQSPSPQTKTLSRIAKRSLHKKIEKRITKTASIANPNAIKI